MDGYQILPDSNDGHGEIKVYKRRWYVLTMYSLYAFIQSLVWNTWGPISTVSADAFGWGDSTIALLNNWGPIAYVLTGLIFPWLLQLKGLRWATLSSMFFVAAGTAFRVITSDPRTATITLDKLADLVIAFVNTGLMFITPVSAHFFADDYDGSQDMKVTGILARLAQRATLFWRITSSLIKGCCT